MRVRGYRLKAAVAALIACPLAGRLISAAYRNRIPYRGCVIRTDNQLVKPAVKASLFWGIYEGAESRFVQRYLRSDLDAVELGSSLGGVAAQISRKLSPDRRLICVEANPNLLPLIRRNVAANSAGARFEVEPGAVHYSDENQKTVRLALGADNTVSHVTDEKSIDAVEVSAITLSQVLQKYGFGDYSLVCDIEGGEAGLLERDGAALRRCQQIIVELHETDWNGAHFTVAQLRERFETGYGFRLRDQYGPVCVFERGPSGT